MGRYMWVGKIEETIIYINVYMYIYVYIEDKERWCGSMRVLGCWLREDDSGRRGNVGVSVPWSGGAEWPSKGATSRGGRPQKGVCI